MHSSTGSPRPMTQDDHFILVGVLWGAPGPGCYLNRTSAKQDRTENSYKKGSMTCSAVPICLSTTNFPQLSHSSPLYSLHCSCLALSSTVWRLVHLFTGSLHTTPAKYLEARSSPMSANYSAFLKRQRVFLEEVRGLLK